MFCLVFLPFWRWFPSELTLTEGICVFFRCRRLWQTQTEKMKSASQRQVPIVAMNLEAKREIGNRMMIKQDRVVNDASLSNFFNFLFYNIFIFFSLLVASSSSSLLPPSSSSFLPPRPSFLVQHCLNLLESVKVHDESITDRPFSYAVTVYLC